MTSPLRPMSTGELLDRTFSLYRKNFVLFVGISAVIQVVYFAYELFTIKAAPFGRASRVGPAFYGNLAIAWLFLIIVTTISQAATVKAVAAVHLDQPTSVWGAYKALRGRIISIFGVLSLIFLIAGSISAVLITILLIIMGLIISGIERVGAPHSMGFNVAVALIFFTVGFASFLAVYVRYALAIQACMVENLRAWRSLKRSAALSKGGRWRIALIYALLVILSWVLALFFARLGVFAAKPWHSWLATTIIVDFARFLSGSLTAPLATIGLSLVYYDERVRKEAFDLELMMHNLEQPGVAAITPVAV